MTRSRYNKNEETASTTIATDNNEDMRIYIQEHLTKFNKMLLKEMKVKLSNSYKYPGYVKNGELRAKQGDTDKYKVVSCMSDLNNLISELQTQTV